MDQICGNSSLAPPTGVTVPVADHAHKVQSSPGGASQTADGGCRLTRKRPNSISSSRQTKKCDRNFTFSKRRRFGSKLRRSSHIVLPTRFLLGGNIMDPLNLGGIESESNAEKSDIFDAASDSDRHRIVPVFPADMRDPLGLKDMSFSADNTMSYSHFKAINSCRKCIRKRNSWSALGNATPTRSENGCKISGLGLSKAEQVATEMSSEKPSSCSTPDGKRNSDGDLNQNCKCPHADKIVSPAIPQFAGKRKKDRRKPRLLKHMPGSPSHPQPSGSSPKKKFPQGNYVAYYGYRNASGTADPRFELFPADLFRGKDVLDVGCNAGLLTIRIAKDFGPRCILGMDVDPQLIGQAKRHLKQTIMANSSKFPVSLKAKYGPLEAGNLVSKELMSSTFPRNILFQAVDYVPESDSDVFRQREEYDVILALSVTKWMHFNHGDAGLRRAFRRMYRQLRPGGKLVLEAQPWQSYRRKRKLTDKIFQVYQTIEFRPEQFNDYLLSADVGFDSCELLGTPCHKSKGFQRSLYVFTKKSESSSSVPAAPTIDTVISGDVIDVKAAVTDAD